LIKQQTVRRYAEGAGIATLVETGTYLGDMVEFQRKAFKKIYSIELSTDLWRAAVERFKPYPHISIRQGDSGTVLREIVPALTEPALFWLDAHYSEGFTARGKKDCPIVEELDAILAYSHLSHVILIDDARCFSGLHDYPTVDELKLLIGSRDSRYNITVECDIIRATPGPIRDRDAIGGHHCP
jgi:hypothetical protein